MTHSNNKQQHFSIASKAFSCRPFSDICFSDAKSVDKYNQIHKSLKIILQHEILFSSEYIDFLNLQLLKYIDISDNARHCNSEFKAIRIKELKNKLHEIYFQTKLDHE